MPQTQTAQQRTDTATFLLEDVRRRLPLKIKPEDAIRAVMCTFSQHVSGGEARHVFEALPELIKPLVERCMIHRGESAESFARDQLIVRVATHLGIGLAEAEQVVGAVLVAISSRLPAKEVAAVASQLPDDLRELWVVHRAPLGAPVTPHPVLSKIEKHVSLPTGVTGEGAFKSVMANLSRHLSLGEARHLFHSFPTDLRQLLDDDLYGRGEHAERFGRREFLERIARDLRMDGDPSAAEEVARAVFHALDEYVPSSVFAHVISQLPRELADIWALPEFRD